MVVSVLLVFYIAENKIETNYDHNLRYTHKTRISVTLQYEVLANFEMINAQK